jgi:hypothetical protein
MIHQTAVITVKRRIHSLTRYAFKPTCRTCPWRGRDTTSPHDAARAGDRHAREAA